MTKKSNNRIIPGIDPPLRAAPPGEFTHVLAAFGFLAAMIAVVAMFYCIGP